MNPSSDQISPLKTLFDSAAGYFLVTDIKSQVLYTNHSIEQRTGFDLPEVIGKKPGQLWGGKMPESFYKKLWHIIGQRQEVFIGTVTNQKKNKELYEENMYVLPIIQNQSVKYFVAFQPNLHTSLEKEQLKKDLQGFVISRQTGDSLVLSKILSVINRNTLHEPLLPKELNTFQILEQHLIAPTVQQYQNRTLDQDLVLSAQNSPQAFEHIYHKYYKTIFLYFFKHLAHQTLSEDFAQETFLRAFSHISKFVSSNATYQTYLLRIAHNILVNHYRSKIPLGLDEHEVTNLHSHDGREEFFAKETLDKVMQNISPLQQDILNQYYNEGYSLREIAEKMGKTENAVKLQLSRARRTLKGFIEK